MGNNRWFKTKRRSEMSNYSCVTSSSRYARN